MRIIVSDLLLHPLIETGNIRHNTLSEDKQNKYHKIEN
jgi:hypothetical protein